MTTRILALEKDLFFSVKMRDTLRHHDMEVKTVRTLPAFEQLQMVVHNLPGHRIRVRAASLELQQHAFAQTTRADARRIERLYRFQPLLHVRQIQTFRHRNLFERSR